MPLLLYLTAIGVRPAYATDADAPQVIIDDMHFPTLVVEAHNARIVDILKELGERLHFQIANLPSESPETATGTFKGDLARLLHSDMLGRMSYVMVYRDGTEERLIIVGSGSGSGPGPRSTTSTTRPAKPAAAENSLQIEAPAPAQSPPKAANRRAEPTSRINRMLHAQAVQGSVEASPTAAQGAIPTLANSVSLNSAADTQGSLAVMTRTARANVQSLVSALRAACIGPNCPR